MIHRDKIRNLKDIKKICAIQRMDIEMQVERSNASLKRLDDDRTAEGKALTMFQDGWRRAVSGRSFHPAITASWSAEILRTESAIAKVGEDIQQEKTTRQGLHKAQTAVTARCDAIDDLLHGAVRVAQRQRDEMALDEHIGRTTVSWRSA